MGGLGFGGGGACGIAAVEWGAASGRPGRRQGEGAAGKESRFPALPAGARRPRARNGASGEGTWPSPPGPSLLRSPFHPPGFVVSAQVCAPRPVLPLTPHSAGLTLRRPQDPARIVYLLGFALSLFFISSLEARGAPGRAFEQLLCHSLALCWWAHNLTSPCFSFLPVKC